MPVATAIMDPELEPEPEPGHRALPLFTEALGYLGAITVLSAGLIAVRQIWPKIPAAGLLCIIAAATALLLTAGAAVPGLVLLGVAIKLARHRRQP